MIIKMRKMCMNFFLTLLGILCILCLPHLFIYNNQMSFQPFLYVFEIEDTLKQLFSLNTVTFKVSNSVSVKEYPFLPFLLDNYIYSLSLIIIAFVVALVLAFIAAYIYMLASRNKKRWMQQVLLICESLPDVMIIVSVQAFFIWVYKKTEFMPFTVLSLQDNRPYVLPILCLCILPTIQLFRFLILYLEEERHKPYVELLKGKGLTNPYIVRVHLFRNVIIHLFYHSKSIFLFMISNLFVLEYIFNVNGLMRFLVDYGSQNIVISLTAVFLIFVPFYVLFSLASLMVERVVNKEGL
ncbi:ABC transporter permease subunit [Bacillus sp. 123MFChir2]|uniref:ABC transporter permease subunit n=1 Tax=Bacillus sp. 123MFChir2 TaxID=1169144 RepID=UPI00037B8ABD|nr:ABC transporter permease subunit [Bacillus sp. 123MFChir2]